MLKTSDAIAPIVTGSLITFASFHCRLRQHTAIASLRNQGGDYQGFFHNAANWFMCCQLRPQGFATPCEPSPGVKDDCAGVPDKQNGYRPVREAGASSVCPSTPSAHIESIGSVEFSQTNCAAAIQHLVTALVILLLASVERKGCRRVVARD